MEILDAIDRGLEPPPLVDLTPTVPEVALSADGLPSPESFRRHDDLRLSRRELLKVAEISEELLASLEQYGLVAAKRGSGHYDSDALVVCTTARDLAAFGLEPRHLRAFKTAADREVGLVEQVLATQHRASDPPRPRAARTPPRSSPRSPCGCTRRWSRRGCAGSEPSVRVLVCRDCEGGRGLQRPTSPRNARQAATEQTRRGGHRPVPDRSTVTVCAKWM